MWDYAWKAATAWFTGFFPFAEIYVAVPAAVATGLDDVSVLVWTIAGNFTPVILIHYLYTWLIRQGRFGQWLQGLASERAQQIVNRYGVGVVVLITPWTGVWVMSVTAKALGMDSRRYMLSALVSITVYAMGILVLLRAGLAAF